MRNFKLEWWVGTMIFGAFCYVMGANHWVYLAGFITSCVGVVLAAKLGG